MSNGIAMSNGIVMNVALAGSGVPILQKSRFYRGRALSAPTLVCNPSHTGLQRGWGEAQLPTGSGWDGGRSSEAKVQPLDKGKDGASCDKGLGGRERQCWGFQGAQPCLYPGIQGCRRITGNAAGGQGPLGGQVTAGGRRGGWRCAGIC